MEDTNEIGNSEIDRIESLERVVNRFKVATAGGSVMGGFGSLPKNQSELSLQERFANIQQARSKFDLKGLNVDIAGSFTDGFKFS